MRSTLGELVSEESAASPLLSLQDLEWDPQFAQHHGGIQATSTSTEDTDRGFDLNSGEFLMVFVMGDADVDGDEDLGSEVGFGVFLGRVEDDFTTTALGGEASEDLFMLGLGVF